MGGLSVGLSILECDLILDKADMRPRHDRTRLPPGFLSQALKLAPLTAAAKRATRRSRYVTLSHEVSLEVAIHTLGVIHLVPRRRHRCSGGQNPSRRTGRATEQAEVGRHPSGGFVLPTPPGG